MLPSQMGHQVIQLIEGPSISKFLLMELRKKKEVFVINLSSHVGNGWYLI
jgi:hypothetical protein